MIFTSFNFETYLKRWLNIYFQSILLIDLNKGNKLSSNLSRIAMVMWLFMALVITQTYTANLASLLTLPQLEPVVTVVVALQNNNAMIGCSRISYVRNYLQAVLQVMFLRFFRRFYVTRTYTYGNGWNYGTWSVVITQHFLFFLYQCVLLNTFIMCLRIFFFWPFIMMYLYILDEAHTLYVCKYKIFRKKRIYEKREAGRNVSERGEHGIKWEVFVSIYIFF